MRKPTPEDTAWIIEAYADYPPTDKNGGFIAPSDVRNWVRRWIHRDDEICLVYEADGVPVGFITYRQNHFAAVVDQIVIRPGSRRKGYANAMIAYLTYLLFKQGVLIATFDTLPGPIRDKYPDGVVTALDL